MNDQEVINKLIATHRKKAKKSLFWVANKLLGFKDVNLRTHGEIIEALEDQTGKRKLIVQPRGSLKSSLSCVAYPIWLLINNPNLRILIESEVYTNSSKFLREIKLHLERPLFTHIFGEFKSNIWNESEIVINQRTIPKKEGSITVGSQGMVKVGAHFDCLHPQTEVLTSNGYIKAKDLRIGMRVLTSSGKFMLIKNTVQKTSDKNIIGIRAKYQAKTNYFTEDHKLLIFRNHALIWSEAKDLQNSDFLVIPKIQGFTRSISRVNDRINRLLTNKDIWRLIGYWLAEGCKTINSKSSHQIRLCFHKDEIEYQEDVKNIVESVLKAPCHIGSVTKSNTRLISFSDKEMNEILSKFGSYSHTKIIPPFALNTFKSRQIDLLKGYWRGDGHATNNTVGFVSTSHDLLTGIQLILAGLDIASGINKLRDAKLTTIASNTKKTYCNHAYSLNSSSSLLRQILGLSINEKEYKPIRSFFTDKYWMVPISKITNQSNHGEVVDIEVDSVQDFYCAGMIAHNCIINDDMNSPKNSNTPENAEKVIDHYKYNTSILEPEGTYVIIGTRYSANDLIGHILANEINLQGSEEHGS